MNPGELVTWTDPREGGNRVGTLRRIIRHRGIHGNMAVIVLGNGSHEYGEPPVFRVPADTIRPYRRQWWPNPVEGGAALDHDPADDTNTTEVTE